MKDTIEYLVKLLQGKKTYIMVFVGAVLYFGADQGWWKISDELLNIIGLGAIATLRAGVKKNTKKEDEKHE